jgi:hypothetical protein
MPSCRSSGDRSVPNHSESLSGADSRFKIGTVRLGPIEIERGKHGPSPADVMPNALAFVRFVNGISLPLILVGAIWGLISLNATAEILFGVGAGLTVVSTYSLVIAVKMHNARLARAADREAAIKASQQLHDLEAN